MTECPSGVTCCTEIECESAPGCTYPEPHFHGFICDKTCTYCHGKGVPVIDPENHPNHVEWQRNDNYWPGKP